MSTEETKNKPLQIWIPTLLGLCMAIGMFIGLKLQPNSQKVVNIEDHLAAINSYTNASKLEEVVRYIDAKYVDDIESESLVDNTIVEILDDLDPHSNYFNKKELMRMEESLRGNYEGIGVEFLIVEDTAVVTKVFESSPAEEAGVIEGDKFVMVEDSLVAGIGITNSSIISLLKGPAKTDVRVSLARMGESELLQKKMFRNTISTSSLEAAFLIDKETGYIKINSFSSVSYNGFSDALAKMAKEPSFKNIIIDVRSNPGGYLQQVIKMLDQLFDEKDKLLVYTEGDHSKKREYRSNGRNMYNIEDVVILIDENSASASEILAGAVQDWDRGKIIGRRSFGKGLVQEQFPLSDGSAIRLTISRYFTPSGRSIQKNYESDSDYSDEIYTRYQSGEVYDEQQIDIVDTAKFFTAGGRVVYGGGGITPDVYVELDSSKYNNLYFEMRNLSYTYAYKEYAKLKSELKSERSFVDNYVVPSDLIQRIFMDNGLVEKYRINELDANKNSLLNFIKARIGRHAFGENTYYKILAEEDKFIQVALEELNL